MEIFVYLFIVLIKILSVECLSKACELAIILMTKNEAPILRSTILYHGEVYGYNNLYIIDGSTSHDAINILNDRKWIDLGVNIRFSNSSLNKIYEFDIIPVVLINCI